LVGWLVGWLVILFPLGDVLCFH